MNIPRLTLSSVASHMNQSIVKPVGEFLQNKVVRIVLAALACLAVAFGLYYLWQRSKKVTVEKPDETSPKQAATVESPTKTPPAIEQKGQVDTSDKTPSKTPSGTLLEQPSEIPSGTLFEELSEIPSLDTEQGTSINGKDEDENSWSSLTTDSANEETQQNNPAPPVVNQTQETLSKITDLKQHPIPQTSEKKDVFTPKPEDNFSKKVQPPSEPLSPPLQGGAEKPKVARDHNYQYTLLPSLIKAPPAPAPEPIVETLIPMTFTTKFPEGKEDLLPDYYDSLPPDIQEVEREKAFLKSLKHKTPIKLAIYDTGEKKLGVKVYALRDTNTGKTLGTINLSIETELQKVSINKIELLSSSEEDRPFILKALIEFAVRTCVAENFFQVIVEIEQGAYPDSLKSIFDLGFRYYDYDLTTYALLEEESLELIFEYLEIQREFGPTAEILQKIKDLRQTDSDFDKLLNKFQTIAAKELKQDPNTLDFPEILEYGMYIRVDTLLDRLFNHPEDDRLYSYKKYKSQPEGLKQDRSMQLDYEKIADWQQIIEAAKAEQQGPN